MIDKKMTMKWGRVLNWVRGPQAPIKFFYSLDAALPLRKSLKELQSPIDDQGPVGSCTGNAIAGALEFLQLEQLRKKLPGPELFPGQAFQDISRLFIYYNERIREGTEAIDSGANIFDGINSVQIDGFCRESLWPYDLNYLYTRPSAAAYAEGAKHRALRAYSITGIRGIKACLASGYPVVFGTEVYESFMMINSTGVYKGPEDYEQPIGGHCLLIVGYDDHYRSFTVKNSWGVGFGDKGYCYLSYDFAQGFADLHTLR